MPSMPMPTENTETQYSIDKELYDSAIAIRDELNLYSERLNKMDEHKSEVSEAVYLRVKSDYLAKLDQVKKSFEEKRQEIQKALLSLYDKKREQEAELQKHKEVLEEAKFRNFLGEITDKKFKETDTRESAEVKRLEKILSTIQANTKQYEDLVGGPIPEHEAEPKPEPKPVAKETPAAAPVARLAPAEEAREAGPPVKPMKESSTPPPPEPEAQEDEEIGYLLEEEDESDYYKKETASQPAAPAAESTPASLAETGKFKVPTPPPAQKPADEKVRPIKSAAAYEDAAAGKPPAPSEKKAAPESAAKAAAAKGGAGMSFDDSISSILRSIPLDEVEDHASEDEAPVPAEESESASPLGGAEEILAAMEEEEEGPSITQVEEKATAARLICVEGEMEPREVNLTENISIGRSPSNDIVLKEAKVSRQHAAINFIRGNYVLVDLKSSNGVFVNGQKIEEHVLQNEDEINIGSFRMVYRAG